jgi:UDP-N-acetylmuramyl pentapeptide phosphotransferase/UDP-N-acetylglucosamine-1-phosphate transferase
MSPERIAIIVLLITAGSALLWRRLLRDESWIDRPRGDRHHVLPVSRAGGVCWITGVLFGLPTVLVLAGGSGPALRAALVVGAGLLLAGLLGRLDDRGSIRAGPKWLAQSAILLVAAALLSPARAAGLPMATLAAVVLVALLLQTALQIFDNMDGALALVSSSAFVALTAVEGPLWLRALAGASAGASLGFFLWNRPPARLFLGNVGSQAVAFMGALLTLLALLGGGTGSIPRTWPVLLPVLWPLFDLAFVTVRRLGRGQPPWRGGRDHTTHALARLVGGDAMAVLIILLASTASLALAHRLLGGAR